MLTYFMEIIETFRSYCGSGILPVLFFAAAIYILITEKESWKKVVMGIVPLFILFMFFLPLTKAVYEKVGMEDGTYYRLLWLLPMGADIAYAACKLFDKHRRIGLAVSIAVVILCSGFNLVYRSQYITKAENKFHIPQAAINICAILDRNKTEERVWAAFPPELVYFIRQYDTDIMLPYGRDYVEAQWDYWNAVCEQMNVTSEEGYDVAALLEATRESKCSYVILNMSIPTDEDPVNEGLVLLAQTDGYAIYQDPTVDLAAQ